MEKDSQEKIANLQIMEQKLQGFIMQKQNFQSQLLEIENALHESQGSDEVYKIVGQIVVKSEKKDLVKELEDKKKLLDSKIKEIEKQEEKIRGEIAPLQEEVMGSLKNDK